MKHLTEEEYQKVMILFANVIQALGEHLKFRQQVIATATVYFKRFYARYQMLFKMQHYFTCFIGMAALAFRIFHKVSDVMPLSFVIVFFPVKNKFGHAFNGEYPYRIQHVMECEFYLLEMMDCCLIMYHPYRPLTKFCADIGSEMELLPVAWRMINDCLRTDIPLLYPPYLIALENSSDTPYDNNSCLHLASIVKQKDIKAWCAELSVDNDKVMEITKTMVGLYEMWKTYDEKKEIQPILAKMPKPSPSRPPSETPTMQDANSQQQQQQNQQLPSGGV
ncbi:hypothetical protein EGW08_012511 [Elysia chlorotica]|uniref:Cyclin-like domain-containing protein n=1 Tax=Elysia chlorotica TaxID=188477 RepID=A0A433TDT6_ELYCH|nr:hypothetical protein EGW08_012511 [Elysia chlorotica]